MKLIRIFIFILASSLAHIGFAEDAKDSTTKNNSFRDVYPSKFGMIQRTDDGSVTLNGKILLQGNSEKDDFGTTIDYSVVDFQVNKNSPAVETQSHGGRKYFGRQVHRLVLVGRSQNPVFYRIVDLTGKEPFISERFGKNDHWANGYKSAEWGKNKSYINLTGEITYLYTTYKDIQGPFAY
jgi:hypothetical protein